MMTLRRMAVVAAGCGAAVVLFASSSAAQDVVFENPRQAGRMKKQLRSYVETIEVWGLVQRIVHEVKLQNGDPVAEEDVRSRDEAWRAGNPPPELVQSLVTNPCAQALQALLGSQPGFSSAFVLDRTGTLACMTSDAPGYSMAREALFFGAFNRGDGVPFVTKPHPDPVLGLDVLEISVPVRDQGETVGVLTVVKILARDE